MESFLHWLAIHTGTIDLSSPYYGFWSGFGSDLGELSIVVVMYGVLRKHTCHVHHCLRLGHHPIGGTAYMVCAKHHPGVPRRITRSEIEKAYIRTAPPPPMYKGRLRLANGRFAKTR